MKRFESSHSGRISDPILRMAGILWMMILCAASTGLEAATFESLYMERELLDKTVWAKEKMAQEYEQSFVKLWDDLRAAKDPYEILGEFEFKRLMVPTGKNKVRQWDLGIQETHYGGKQQVYTHQGFRELLKEYQSKGYTIEQTEWHHSKFISSDDKGALSEVAMVLHVKNTKLEIRLIVTGDLVVTWSGRRNHLALPLEREQ